ncbi:helix-turn-helix domain-containing protein [Thermoflexus sp.]|uniref:helix-turn-helix domain-containing protein n=1 Tax=Thermoflexus sp. TaxID=1969742 RepID=UPI003330F793
MRVTAERRDPRELAAEGLVTVREAQRFLGIGHNKLYELMAAGEIPYVHIGAARRIPRAALVEYVARNLRGGRGA